MQHRKTTVTFAKGGQWIAWLGHSVRYLATGEQTNGQYCLSAADVAKGQGAPSHRHEFDEAFYVLAGQMRFAAGTQAVELQAGDFIHIRGGTVHRPEALPDSRHASPTQDHARKSLPPH